MDSQRTQTLELHRVSKAYPGVRALDDISVEFKPGEIHGIVGQNGAGKSTLIKIVSGDESPSSGSVLIDGESVDLTSSSAVQHGVAVVHQELQSLLEMSVTENVMLGSVTTKRALINWKQATNEAAKALAGVGLELDPRTRMSSLNPAERKLVEIARALYVDSTILLLDEPTAALEAADSEIVVDCMRRLRDTGKAIVFISHHLEEVHANCDRVTVLRDGRSLGTFPILDVPRRKLVELMVGSVLDDVVLARSAATGPPALEVLNWSVPGRVEHADLTVGRGEIVGLAGLMGGGRTEFAQSLFGARRHVGGAARLDGKDFVPRSPADSISRGVAYVPSDRQSDGLVFSMSLRENISLAILRRLSSRGWLKRGKEHNAAADLATRLQVKTGDLESLPETLSGGNQQKVMLARWLATDPTLIMFNEPTQGIDVAAKAEVHRLLGELAAAGMGVLVISSDTAELVTLCDRIVVVRRGRFTDELPRGTTELDLILAITDAKEVAR